MKKHLQTNKLIRVFLAAVLIGFAGTTNLFAQIPEEAIIGGCFTVNSAGDKVVFSKGNLQYIGSASTPYWKFADNQWDCLGTTTGQNSSDQNVDRDLFGWGTSGYNHGATCYQPWSVIHVQSDYYVYGSSSYNLYDQTGQADWGYNAISNGGNTENSGWRTLTYDEWTYVFNTRSTPSGKRYAKARVNDVSGVILLPDGWRTSVYSLNNTNSNTASYYGNVISVTEWPALEQAGAVFLPAAGHRVLTSVNNFGSSGFYWSASYNNSNSARGVYFYYSGLIPDTQGDRCDGFSVRLVCSAENYSFNINATPNPALGGAVSGGGTYQGGADCTLTATPSANYGYVFVNWTENGTVVSTDATYTFSVTGDRTLVANFEQQGNITFADANVKALCVTHWDTDGDGELSYTEAASVTSLGNVFKNKTNIHSFNELSYFISLGSIGEQAFYGCTELTQITIPRAVSSVRSKAFWNCPALQTVRFNAVNCTSMLTTYNNQTYSVFASDASGGTPAVKSVIIANGVIRIPDYAFKNCAQIYPGMTIRSSVTRIGAHAFENCSSMTTLSFQNNSTLATIGDYAFSGCSALNKALNIPNSVTTIGQYAFYGCVAIPTLTIGTSVETIGGYAFWNCPSMSTVHFNATNCATMVTNSQYSVFNVGTSDNGATPIVTLTIGDNVTKIPEYAFYNSTNLTSSITIPDATISIGQYAFGNCSLIPSMLIGDGVSTIGDCACLGCSSLGLLTIGEGVTTIGSRAFWECPALATVHFNATNCTSMYTQINDFRYSVFNSGTGAGVATPIVTLTIGDNVTKIPDYAFKNSRNAVGSLLLPDVLTYLGKSAFWGCNSFTGDLAIPNTVTYIGDDAFNGCSGFNGTLTLPVNVGYQTICSGTFYGCTGLMGTLTIPANVTEIESQAFRDCSGFSGSLVLHDAITFIGQYAFYGCSSIDELTIGEGVTTIGGYAFWNCPNLATVHFNATNCTTMVTNSQYSVFNAGTSNGGNTPIVNLTIGENVTKIPNYAFRNSSNMMGDLIIPNSVTSIGTFAFANCGGHNVFTGKSVTSIPHYAFFGSSFNGTLMLGDALASIGQYAFQNCSSFTGDLVIPNAVTTMGNYAFSGCSGFNGSLILGNGIQTINQYTFSGCSGFRGAMILGTEVNDIKNYAFQNCSAFSLLITENADPVTATSSSFTGMTYNTIPVYVPNGLVDNYQNATGWSNFTNYIEQYTFWQELDTDNWSDELNWMTNELPSENDVVCIAYNCDVDIDVDVLHVYVYNINDVLTVKSGKTLNTTYGVGVVQPSQLVMEEGSQLYNTIPGVSGTVKKQITGYGTGNDGWYTIAAPIYAGMPVNTLATGNYDLYAYDEPTAMWLNQKVPGNFDELNPAQGYLYASQTGRTANFAGQLNASNAEISIPVTYTSGELAGFNLVGNPYTNNINIGNVKINGTAQTAFYRAEGGSSFVAYVAADNEPIKPGDGFLVKATEAGTLTFDFTPSREDAQQGSYVRLVLNKDNQVADRAYLVVDEGEILEKMSTANAHSKLYFKNGNDRYAVAENESYNGSMPLYLENAFGRYTIEASLLNAQCDYLHLIDNITGDNIDLLKTPSYTFMSSPRDREDRFTLVFDAFEDVDNEVFAYQNGDDIVISGNGELQIFDVMGRMVATQRINGVETYGRTSLHTGVYIFRLVGNEVKSQKIVVD